MKKLLSSLLVFAMSVSFSAAEDHEFSDSSISVGVVVADLDESVAFYTNVIGMTRTGDFDVPSAAAKKLGLTNGPALKVTVLRLKDSPKASQWKLMSFGDLAKPQRGDHITGFTGMQYITINVKNLTPFVARLKAHGVKLLGETPASIGENLDFVLVQDPDGTFIELIGPLL